jgi:hypothetical protein
VGSLALVILVAAAAVVTALSACTDAPGADTTGPASATTADPRTTTLADAMSRLTPGGEVAGLVLKDVLTLDEVRELGADLGGDLIAVFRADYACVRPITFGAPEWEPEPSRFSYVDAEDIRARRVAAVDAGLSPPITGWAIAESYWLHWEDQWNRAQDSGVAFEAVAVYLPPGSVERLSDDPRFTAATLLPSRRTDTLSPSFAGELLLETEEFPPDLLSSPPTPDCGS